MGLVTVLVFTLIFCFKTTEDLQGESVQTETSPDTPANNYIGGDKNGEKLNSTKYVSHTVVIPQGTSHSWDNPPGIKIVWNLTDGGRVKVYSKNNSNRLELQAPSNESSTVYIRYYIIPGWEKYVAENY